MRPRILICSTEQFRNAQGIHLLCPDTWYLEDSIQVAERDGFQVIYAHYETDSLIFRISCDALAALFRLMSRGYIVDVAHIAAIKEPKRGAK